MLRVRWGGLVLDLRPITVGHINVSRNILCPTAADGGVNVEIKLTADHSPDIGIAFKLQAPGGAHATKPAILGQIPAKIGGERLLAFLARKIIRRHPETGLDSGRPRTGLPSEK